MPLYQSANGAVFRAINERQQLFAIKRFHREAADKQIQNEIELVTHMHSVEPMRDCPNLLKFVQIVSDPGDATFKPGIALVFATGLASTALRDA